MAFGWKVFDSSGNTIVDTADRVGTIVGTFSQFLNTTVAGNTNSGSFYDANLLSGSPFYIVSKVPTSCYFLPSDPGYSTYQGQYFSGIPTITFSGGTCDWKVQAMLYNGTGTKFYGNGAIGTLTFYYGYF